MHSNLDNEAMETSIERHLRTLADGNFSSNWHSVYEYAVPRLICKGLLVPVSSWWSNSRFSRSLFAPTLCILDYYSNLILNRQDSDLISGIEVFEFCVCLFVVFWLSAPVSGLIGFSIEFVRAGNVNTCDVLLPMQVGAPTFVQSMGFFRIMSDCMANFVKTYYAHSCSLQVG